MEAQTARRRRRVATAQPGPNLGPVVKKLREQHGLSQRTLASEVGLKGSSTISRLESGDIDHASHTLITKLADVLGNPNEFWAAVLTLPDHAISELAPYWRAFSRQNLLGATAPAVRRVHYRDLAAELLNNAPDGTIDRRVDPRGLAAAVDPPRALHFRRGQPSIRLTETTITVTTATTVDDPLRTNAVHRFLGAHAVAHLLIDDTPSCTWPSASPIEEQADELACHLVAPGELVETTLRRLDRDIDPWHPEAGNITAKLAEALIIPSWVAVRRLSDEDLLYSTAEDIAL